MDLLCSCQQRISRDYSLQVHICRMYAYRDLRWLNFPSSGDTIPLRQNPVKFLQEMIIKKQRNLIQSSKCKENWSSESKQLKKQSLRIFKKKKIRIVETEGNRKRMDSQDINFTIDTTYSRPPARIIMIRIPVRKSPVWIWINSCLELQQR